MRFPQPASLGNTRTRTLHPLARRIRFMPMWWERPEADFSVPLLKVPGGRLSFFFARSGRGVAWRVRSPLCEQNFQHVRSLQRKAHVSVVWLVLVQNLRTKTRRDGSLTWFLGLMERGGVRTRHDQCTLTAMCASNSHVGVGHPSLRMRPQSEVSMKR